VGDERFPLLASVTHHGTRWHADRWTLATCDRNETREPCLFCLNGKAAGTDGRIPTPAPTCSCGMYAAKSWEQLVELRYAEQRGQQPVFVGEVAMAGKVIPGSQGWRAEKGRIESLIVPVRYWRYAEPLADLYGVEVTVADVNDMLRRAKEA
jgi:hypothetical protein